MGRMLLWVVLGLVAWWWLRRLGTRGVPPRRPTRVDAGAAPQDMVRCAQCGVFLPRADAVADARPPSESSQFYCSEHRRTGRHQ